MLSERRREAVMYTEEEEDEYAVALKVQSIVLFLFFYLIQASYWPKLNDIHPNKLKYIIIFEDYTRSRNALQRLDDQWIRDAMRMQSKALAELKKIDPVLWEKVSNF